MNAVCPRCNRSQCQCRRPKAKRKPYGLTAWRLTRSYFLANNAYCHDCDGIATEVHHVIPVRQRPDLLLDLDNLMALCKACHARRSAAGE